MGESLDEIGGRRGGAALQRGEHSPVQGAPAVVQEAAVRHLVGQDVAKRVDGLGKEGLLLEQLGLAQPSERRPHLIPGQLGHRLQEPARHVLADDRRGLHDALVPGRQAVDARLEHRAHRRRDVDRPHRAFQPVPAARAGQRAALRELAHRLLQEEGVAAGALDQEPLERRQVRASAHQRVQQPGRGVRAKRLQVDARGACSREPSRVIVRSIRHQHERERHHALREELERVLGVGIHPLQVLERAHEGPAARPFSRMLGGGSARSMPK
jgi:hypothetical protein